MSFEEPVAKSSWARIGTVFACGAALFADGYVNSAGGASRYVLQKAYPNTYTAHYGSLFSSLQFVGIVIGQLGFGYLSDRVGRKPGMIFASVWIMLFSVLSGLAWSPDSANLWRLLIAYRFLIGIGIGAEYPAGSVAASENTEDPGVSKKFQSGLLVLATNTAIDWGFVVAYLVPYISLMIFGEDNLEWIWRLTLGFGAVSAFITLFFRLSMHEPKLYQKSSMKNIPITQLPWGLIFKKYWGRLLGVCVAWAVYDWIAYPAGIYSSTIVDAIIPNADMRQTLGWDAIINAFYLPGTMVGALFIDRLGPKYTMITGFVCQSLVGFGMSGGYVSLQKHAAGFAVLYGIYLSFGEFGPGNCLGVLASKATGPTAVRGIFYAIAAAIGKLFAFVATYVYTDVFDIINDLGGSGTTKGDTGPVYIGSALSLFAAIIAFFFIPNINADFMRREDEIFREYLAENGFDVTKIGMTSNQIDAEKAVEDRKVTDGYVAPASASEKSE
ncbi:putative glycerophosphoinositol permease [Pseudohyphozyma bogoriensis]|nr:putative glycerophosphoinositol permease [Pseudohyphozyma bogoriensis]